MKKLLQDLAFARCGEKGANLNIGIIARDQAAFELLKRKLTPDWMGRFFHTSEPVVRHEMPNLLAFNFILKGVLSGGSTVSLRLDVMARNSAPFLLETEIEVD